MFWAIPVLASGPSSALNSTEETFNHFKAAVEISEKEFKACDPMLKAQLAYKPSAEDGKSLKDKAEALEQLAIMEKNSYEFPGGDIAADMIVNKLDKLAEYPDQEAAMKLIGRIKTNCDLLLSLHYLRLLLKYENKFFFTPEEKARIQTAAKKFLLDKTPGGSLISIAVHGDLLREYLEYSYKGADRKALIEDTEAYLADFERSRQTLRPTLKEFYRTHPKPTVLYRKIESDLTRVLEAKYKALIKRVFKERA